MPTESEIISLVRRRARGTDCVVIGVGDDAAVFRSTDGKDLICCSDLMVEGVHFRQEWAPAKLIGRKALASTLSDVAAMGALARLAMISVAIPPGLLSRAVDELFEGVFELADSIGVSIVGGDTSSSPYSLFIDVSIIGECERGKAVTRSGARVGDTIYVTGALGASAFGLRLLERGSRLTVNETIDNELQVLRRDALMKHLVPEPRLACGEALGKRELATAMIDISDGLSTDLSHLTRESKCGAIIHSTAIPIAPSVAALAPELQVEPLTLAIHGGEEYELLFTAPPEMKKPIQELASELRISIAAIGEITEGAGIQLETASMLTQLAPEGFEHRLS